MRRPIHLTVTAVVMAVAVYVITCGAREGRLAECLVLAAIICPVLLFALALVMETLTVLFRLRHANDESGKEELEPVAEEA